jgi:hypothetical protein
LASTLEVTATAPVAPLKVMVPPVLWAAVTVWELPPVMAMAALNWLVLVAETAVVADDVRLMAPMAWH